MTDHSFYERFRVVLSDPMNNLIPRHPDAGQRSGDWVTMHNGQQVKYGSYYGPDLGNFFDIMLINKGVHEPQEEYAFSEVLKSINRPNPSMLELGAYWSFYSMWFLQQCPKGMCTMVEPDQNNINYGRENFKHNGLTGDFISSYVSPQNFTVDYFMEIKGRLDILHSDIQGHEVDMLKNASRSLKHRLIDYVFISSHGDNLHEDCLSILRSHDYKIMAEANAEKSFCFDGVIVASSPNVPFKPIDFSDRRTTELVPEGVVDELLKNIKK
jgi:hypothetical protein